jgi:hypothetical protein
MATITRPAPDRLRVTMNVYVTLDELSEEAPADLAAIADDAATDARGSVYAAMAAAGLDPDSQAPDGSTPRPERRYGRAVPAGRIEVMPAA